MNEQPRPLFERIPRTLFRLPCIAVAILLLLQPGLITAQEAQTAPAEPTQEAPVQEEAPAQEEAPVQEAAPVQEEMQEKEEPQEQTATRMRALILDGQNNHKVWPKTTKMMQRYLEETGLFVVDVATSAAEGTDPDFNPDFSAYSVIISNYNGADWPEETRASLDEYMKQGGGLVIVHAADNAFSSWPEYNQMIGLGGWGGRNEESGPYVYFNESEELVRDESAGRGGGHGPQHEFTVVVRDSEHPITNGMPDGFLHTKDELYQTLRGPASNMQVLATAWADKSKKGTARHEPMAMVIDYGEGRVFHTPMGHADYSMACTGFITLLQRGTEWAATGEVTQEIPDDLPSTTETTSREFVEQDESSAALASGIVAMMDALETKPAAEIFELIAIPEQLEQMKASGIFEQACESFDGDSTKKDRLLTALKNIPRSLIEVDGDQWTTPTPPGFDGPSTLRFNKSGDSWYLSN